MGSDSVESNFFKFRNVSSFKEVIVNGRGVEMVHDSIYKYKLGSESSVLNFFEESIVKSSNIGTRFVFNSVFTAISVSGLMTEHNM